MVTIEWVARRYNVLPSQLLREGDSIDILLADLGSRYETYMHKKADAKQKGIAPPAPELNESQMTAMLDAVKKRKKQ
jgi:hypothetical protein